MIAQPFYSIVVIGGGWGGISAARKAASAGKKVLLIEKNKLGGLCLHRGCIPSKALLWVAKGLGRMERLSYLGILPGDISKPSWKAIRSYAQSVIEALCAELSTLMKMPQLEVVLGSQAQFLSPHEIEIASDRSSRKVSFEKAVIACGTEIIVPEVFKPYKQEILTSATLFDLEDFPKSLLIVGAGAIGCEFASFFARCQRTRVSLVEIKDQILPGEDPWIAQGLEQALMNQGIAVKKSTEVKEIRKQGAWKLTLSSGEQEEFEQILLATGRSLEASALGLNVLPDLKANTKAIIVNTKLQTTLPHIYAIGDANGLSLFAHAASIQGEIAAVNAYGGNAQFDPLLVPRCLYTEPEAASIGLFIHDLEQKGIEYKALRGSFSGNSRAVCEGLSRDTPTRIQILMEKGSRKILGAQLLGPMASELIHIFSLALSNLMSAEDLKKAIFAHPTFSESLAITLQKA